MKQKKIFMSCLLAACAMQASAQKIDFNLNGKQNQSLADGYVNWSPGRVKTKTESFKNAIDSTITVTISAADGVWSNGVRDNWNKDLVSKKDKLIYDGIYSCYLYAKNDWTTSTTEAQGIKITISGLEEGSHTLCAYHNNSDAIEMPPLKVIVNNNVVLENVAQTAQAASQAECGMSYITFNATKGQNVVVEYISVPATGATYQTTSVGINALIFDRPNPKTAASDPTPENADMHVDCDENGTATLSWTPASLAVKHRVYIGTSEDNMQLVAEVTDATFTTGKLSTHENYYWRIDEVDADNNVYNGDTWRFRPRRLAFPEAEGYGRFAQGGRDGVVYHVTNLSNDHTPGSLVYGLVDMEGPRTIVFDVSGLIDMNFEAQFVKPYVTIAAQTAPGKGICLKHSNINIGSDCIVQFLRAKRGYGDTGNAMGAAGADHTIIDHTTAAWGTDETFSSRGAKNLTFQYSMIAEALGIADHKNYPAGTNHGYAATIDGKVGTFSHNLLVNCEGRNWSMGGGMDGNNMPIGQMDIFNNVCYNWYKRTTDGGCHEVNFVNNYYKMGTDTQLKILFSQDYELPNHNGVWQAYISGNIRENADHTLTNDALNDTYRYTLKNSDVIDPNTRTDGLGYKTFVSEPFFPSYATIHSAKEAFKIVTSNSGATRPVRDDQHVRVVRETVDGTYTYVGSRSGIKGEIDHENDITTSEYTGFEIWPEESRAADFDTDQDGMPNWYEELTGSNPDVADNNEVMSDDYTRLEHYLDFMAHACVMVAPNQTVTFDAKAEFKGFTASPKFTIQADDSGYSSEINDGVITITAGATPMLGKIIMTVTDNDGTQYSQPLGVVISDKARL
ncbi:MAG: hypothetical protein K6A78_03175 [Prevotella sp.]|nr:hypothetical protein [Prevotella sp.]